MEALQANFRNVVIRLQSDLIFSLCRIEKPDLDQHDQQRVIPGDRTGNNLIGLDPPSSVLKG